MGEQPKPVEDEVERALASMRAGFLSGSEQIAAHIASLDEHLVDAPGEEREAVRAQVARLVASHDRITARVVSAPASAWDSFKVMVSAVKQQQSVLDEVSHLVKEHVLPRQLDSLPITPFPGAAPPPDEEPPAPQRNDPLLPHHPFPADDGLRPGDASRRASDIFRPDDSLRAGAGVQAGTGFPHGDGFHSEALAVPHNRPAVRRQPRPQPPPRSRSETGFRALAAAGLRARQEADLDEPERPSLLALVRERTAGFKGLAAMVAVGIILSLLPRERLQEVGTRLFELIGPAGSETALDDRPPDPPAPPVPRSVERVPSAADGDALSPPPVPKTKTAVASAAPKEPAAESLEEAPVAAPEKPAVARAEKAPPQAAPKLAAASEAAAEPSVTEERFVPVVFTHKDHATVLRALSDLKKQYPNILIGLEGEIQPLDFGRKGIWHRLVFLPPGPRPQATKVCDQLAAKGYDRCWVKAY